MYIRFDPVHEVIPLNTLLIECPFCGGLGSFIPITGQEISLDDGHSLTLRYCPNVACWGIVVAILQYNVEVIMTYPAIKRKIDTKNVPQKITDAFKEAVDCYSNNCFVAAAIMIRKTLEEICLDKGASGKSLYHKIQDLSNKIVIPKELIEAIHELRLLGNDAAHIEAETYNKIGNDELKISIDFTQEIIKAIYQYETLLKELRRLKKPIVASSKP